MKSETSDADTFRSGPALPASTVFELLVERRRRYALYYLSKRVGAVSLEEIAEQIALWEETPTRDRFERITTGLHHNHLPRLIDANVVRYDPVEETVQLLPAAGGLEPYLGFAMGDDLAA